MDTMLTILWQVVTIFILGAVGYVMFKTGKISPEGSKTIGNLLIYLSLPCVIINSFLVERTPEKLSALLFSTIAAAAVLALAMILSRLLLGRHAIDNFAGSFSNAGFFGIPLIEAVIGSGGVFYIAAIIAFVNLLQWTYGGNLLDNSDENGLIPKFGEKKSGSGTDLKALGMKTIKAPFMIAIIIGLFFFLTGLRPPAVVGKSINYIAALNTPVAMFTIGIYLAQTDVLKMFAKPRLYLVSLVRLVIIPLASLALLCVFPASMNEMKLAVLIAAATPVGSNIAVYAQLHNKDYVYAVETVVISTLLSILTLPFITGLGGIVFG